MAENTSSSTIGNSPGNAYGTTQSPQHSGTGTGIVDRVKESATAQLSTQKDRATDGLGTVASAVRQTTQSLRDQHHDTVAGYVEQAADQIERLSERLKNKDVSELLNDAQRLAQRKPALFVGGAFALGLVGARFLKSSSDRDEYEYSRGTYESYGSTSAPYGTGRPGASTEITGSRSRSNLGAAGTSDYASSSYGSAPGSTTTPSSATGSTAGSVRGRDDRERF